MAEIKLQKSKAMLLMADFTAGNMGQNPIVEQRHTLERAREVLDAAREAGIFVAYCCPTSGRAILRSPPAKTHAVP